MPLVGWRYGYYQSAALAAISRWGASGFQSCGVPAHVIFHVGRYEVIAVVIASVAAKGQRDLGLPAGVFQQVRAKLFGQELIGIAIVDQEIGKPRPTLDKGDSIVLAPGGASIAEISAQRLDPPWYL